MALLDQIKAAVTSSVADLSGARLKDLEEKNLTFSQRISQLEGQLSSAQADNNAHLATIKTAGEEKLTLTQRVQTLETENAQLKTEKTDLEAKLADPKGEINRRAGLKAAEIAAAQGCAPIAAAPAENPAAPKQATEGLKGHARIAAATKAQLDRDYPISARN